MWEAGAVVERVKAEAETVMVGAAKATAAAAKARVAAERVKRVKRVAAVAHESYAHRSRHSQYQGRTGVRHCPLLHPCRRHLWQTRQY